MTYLFQVMNEGNKLRLIGRMEEGGNAMAIHTLEEVVDLLVDKFDSVKRQNPGMVYPYMTLVAIATEIGLDRDDEAVNQAWEKIG